MAREARAMEAREARAMARASFPVLITYSCCSSFPQRWYAQAASHLLSVRHDVQ